MVYLYWSATYIKELLDQYQSNSGQQIMPAPFKASSTLEDFLMNKMMHELIAGELEIERFHYLCEYAFEFRWPSMEETEFYTKWSGKPYMSQPLEPEVFFNMLADLIPEVEFDLSDIDGTLQGNRLMHERIKEAFGFRPM